MFFGIYGECFFEKKSNTEMSHMCFEFVLGIGKLYVCSFDFMLCLVAQGFFSGVGLYLVPKNVL